MDNTTKAAVKRIRFLDVPVDAVEPEEAIRILDRIASDGERHHVALLTLRKLMRARRDMLTYRYLSKASLVLPVSRGIVRGARFQRKPELSRYEPFEFVIRVLTLAEETGRSVYLLGGRKDDLLQAERNLRTSFPALRIIGRYAGRFGKHEGKSVVMAIRKAAPAFLLVGSGIPGRETWIATMHKELAPGIAIWVDDCFEIFANRRPRPSREAFERGTESFSAILRRPWLWLRLIPFVWFKLLVLWYRITRR
jgi:N-acetylglucosaminyldiphosphoundecaprenol N-acetyl-beta-D-mannosaminyltransferase